MTLAGALRLEVPAGSRLVLRPGGPGGFTQQLLPLGAAPSWQWRHSLDDATGVVQLTAST